MFWGENWGFVLILNNVSILKLTLLQSWSDGAPGAEKDEYWIWDHRLFFLAFG